jgi:hypothetical protein
MSDSTRTIRSRYRRPPSVRVPACPTPHGVDIRTTGERRALVGTPNAPEWAPGTELNQRAPRTGIRVTKLVPPRPAVTAEDLETLRGAFASAKRACA